MMLFFSILNFFRPLNIFLGVLTSFVVSYLIDTTNFLRIIDLGMIIIFYMAGANALNDLIDIEIDRINKPHRFLVQYSIQKKYIILLIVVLFLMGSWKALAIYPVAKNIALFFVLPFLILYEIILKRIPLVGNIIISLLVGSVFIYTEAGLINDIVVTWKIFILAFMLNLIREIIKDVQDIDGDNSNNITTLPILIGVYPTIIFLKGLSFIFILVSMHPSYTYQYSIYYIPLILFSIHIPLLYIMWGLRVDITTKKLNHFSNLLKIMIINGIIIILLSH